MLALNLRSNILGLSFVVLAGVGSVACHRWNDNVPHTVEVRSENRDFAYAVALTTLREKGYRIIENDEARGFLKAMAKLDGDIVLNGRVAALRASYFSFQALPNGKLRVSATGYHVHDEDTKIHVRLDQELRVLLGAIEDNAKQVAAERPIAAPASTTM